jgi:Ca2+-binding RTX toxin-like protein
MKRGTLFTALLLGACAATASIAAGSWPSVSVSVDAGGAGARAAALGLSVTGSPQADEIAVSLDGTQTKLVITSSRPINPPTAPCVQISPSRVQCPKSQFDSFSASLGAGDDTFRLGPSIIVPASLAGGVGKDTLQGGSAADMLFGGVGRDRLLGRNGRDTVNGGKGRDVASGGRGNDTLDGGKGPDVLKGGSGRDLLRGGPGNDKLRGGPGRDVEKQ